MDKPKSLSVKDFLIRKMAPKMLLPENVIETIVSHQFSSAKEAMFSNNSIEFSGWGKFLFNEKRAKRKLESSYAIEKAYMKALDGELTENKRHKILTRLKCIQEYILSLKPKINVSV